MTPRQATGLAVAALLAACDPKTPDSPPGIAPSPSSSAVADERPASLREKVGLIEQLPNCEVRHHGFLLDLGVGAAQARRGFRIEPGEGEVDAEREGSTVTRVSIPRVSYEVPVDADQKETELSLRVRGGAARSVTAILGERRLGTLRLSADETRTLAFPVLKTALAAGRTTVTLIFSGRSRGSREALAEIDWIRVGPPDENLASYAAPTLRDLTTDAVLDGVPRRAIALRAPASIRCRVFATPNSEFRTDLGFWGDGRGALDVRVLSDGEAPALLAERRVTGGTGATWTPLTIDLKDHASRMVMIELRAVETSKGGRVLFGDPVITRTRESTHVPAASTVVLFVSAGTDRRSVPPWGPTGALSTVGGLIREGVSFSHYRVPTTVPASVVATLITGEAPAVHSLEDPAARLPAAARTLAELLKEASGRAAMFTAAPTTSAAFGFDAGWDRFVQISPVQDIEATQPITAAARWLDDELRAENTGRRLLVIHARGAHPPWDISREEAAQLPPEEYGGAIEPRRGGIALARLRTQRRGQKRKLDDADWVRLRALEHAALVKQDVALGQLVAVLKKKGIWDSTLFVFVGDVASGEPPETPHDPAGELDEDRLLVPLLVKFPMGKFAAKEVHTPVSTEDVAVTILRALELQSSAPGADLYAAADGVEPLVGRGLVAALGDRYTTRFGPWLLRGRQSKTPTLCRLDVAPACVNDVFSEKPIAGWAAWQSTYDFFASASTRRLAPREPASIDPDTGAALTVWGDI